MDERREAEQDRRQHEEWRDSENEWAREIIFNGRRTTTRGFEHRISERRHPYAGDQV